MSSGSRLKIKVEGDEYEEICRDLVDMAIESEPKDCHVLLRVLQLLLYGEWEEKSEHAAQGA